MGGVGTLAWADQTNGRLRIRDRVELARLAAITASMDLPRRLALGVGLRQPMPASVLDPRLFEPSAAACVTARAALGAMPSVPDYLINHSLRTYWFSHLIGTVLGVPFDDDLLYLASLAHDVGLLRPASLSTSDSPCFAIRGAAWAESIAREHGWTGDRIARLKEAVIINLNGRVPTSMGIEANLMMHGVLLDVTGLYAWQVNASDREAIFAKYHFLDLAQG
jgi:hypothetical protein